MQDFPLISVIIPCYNVENYITECLNSIISQSYENLEIIIINDGSTDNTEKNIQNFLQDSRVKYYYQENKGLSEARNTGLNNKNGEYICFVDSDDFIHKNYIKRLFENLIKYNADISLCDFIYYRDGKFIPHEIKEKINSPIIISDRNESMKIINEDFRYVVAWNKLYKASLFNNIRFTPNKIHEDEFIIHHLYWQTNKIVRDTKILYYYRQIPNSIMNSSYTDAKLQNAIEAFEDRINFYKINNIPHIKNIYRIKWYIIYSKGLITLNLPLAKKYILEHPTEYFLKLKGISLIKKFKTYFNLWLNKNK